MTAALARAAGAGRTRRTTSSSGPPTHEHEAVVQEFVQRIYDAGQIYEGVYAGLYCLACEAFYSETELVDGKCPQHGTVPERVEEKNWFFRLSAFQDAARPYDANPEFVLPRIRYNEARSFIEQGLEDI